MRTGILGGTFNPVHLGHLRAAEEVRKKFKLDIIYFIPCNKPPHKTSNDLLPANHRYKILKSAIKALKSNVAENHILLTQSNTSCTRE